MWVFIAGNLHYAVPTVRLSTALVWLVYACGKPRWWYEA
jgi:hypothetical protein